MVAVLATALLLAPLADARSKRSTSAKELVACVKLPKGSKKNGTMLFRQPTTTGCKKGWMKIWWNNVGPQGIPGPEGPAGPKIYVTDATGARVGQFLGYSGASPFFVTGSKNRSHSDRARSAGGGILGVLQTVAVLRDGGIYSYLMNGRLWPSAFGYEEIYWSDNACSQSPFLAVGNGDPSLTEIANDLALAATGQQRLVTRSLQNGFGAPAQAFTGTGVAEFVSGPQDVYRINNDGNCVGAGAESNFWILPLKAVTTPPDFKGPLTVG